MSDIALPITGVPPGLTLPGRLLSDERLARLASAGNARALAVLYERHHQALYRYCRSIVRDHDDAQDALQSTMTHAFMALRASDRDLAVRPWLFRIAHNEAVSILRKRRPDDCLVDEHLPSDISVERTVDQRERLRVLVSDLKTLPERQRAALLMRELSGLPIKEIAVALSVSTGAAKQTVFEARSSLHELAQGRVMECETVRRAISDGDGRMLRGRGIGAHLHGCAGCRDFRALIDTRTADLRALAPPLPAATATAMLARVLAHGAGGGHAGGAAVASTAALGNHAAASLVVKGLVGVAVIAAATAGTFHLVRGPVKHRHTSTAAAPVVAAHAGVVGYAGAVVNAKPAAVAETPRVHSIRAIRAVHGHAGPGHGTLVSTGIQPETRHTGPSPATPAVDQGKVSPQHIHGSATGNAHRASGERSRGSNKAQPAPHGPKHSHRSHSPSKPSGPSTSSQSQGPAHSGKSRGPSRESGGNGHTPQAHQAPIPQQPATGEKGNKTYQQTMAPGTPGTHHGAGGK
jgi:RNA polymerase sigma factor (sigma-70 family)